MKQRLGIAQALINDPLLLICDEPTSALDPVGRKQLLTILEKVKNKTTVIFSTHILSDVEAICDEVAILDKGKIVEQGSLKQLKTKLARKKWSVMLETVEEAVKVKEALTETMVTFNISQKERIVKGEATEDKEAMRSIMGVLTRLSIVPRKIERTEPTMEDVFLEAIK